MSKEITIKLTVDDGLFENKQELNKRIGWAGSWAAGYMETSSLSENEPGVSTATPAMGINRMSVEWREDTPKLAPSIRRWYPTRMLHLQDLVDGKEWESLRVIALSYQEASFPKMGRAWLRNVLERVEQVARNLQELDRTTQVASATIEPKMNVKIPTLADVVFELEMEGVPDAVAHESFMAHINSFSNQELVNALSRALEVFLGERGLPARES
jgi:hypothetical protein